MIQLTNKQKGIALTPESPTVGGVVIVAWTAGGLTEAVRITRHGKEGRQAFVRVRPMQGASRAGIARVRGTGFNIGAAASREAAENCGFVGIPDGISMERLADELAYSMGYSTTMAVEL